MSEPAAVVHWSTGSCTELGLHWSWEVAKERAGAVPTALAAMRRCVASVGRPLRWECAGPHTFHGYAKDPEPAYESELP